MTNRKRKWESRNIYLRAHSTVYTCTEKPLKAHLLRVNNMYLAMWTPEFMWSPAGTCLSSINSQDLQDNNLELQRHLLITLFSCYRSQTDWQTNNLSTLYPARLPKTTLVQFSLSFKSKISFFFFPHVIFPSLIHYFQSFSPSSNPKHPTYFNSMAAVLSSLFSGVKTNAALYHLILLISDIL